MVEVNEQAFLEIERAFRRNRINYYTFAQVNATGVVVRYAHFQSQTGLGFATAMFNQMTKGIDRDTKAVISYVSEQFTWYYVIPTSTPRELEEAIRGRYTDASNSMGDNA